MPGSRLLLARGFFLIPLGNHRQRAPQCNGNPPHVPGYAMVISKVSQRYFLNALSHGTNVMATTTTFKLACSLMLLTVLEAFNANE